MKPSARHRARELAVQALYQVLFSGQAAKEVAAQYIADINPKKTDEGYFREIFFGVTEQIEKIDKLFSPFLDRAIGDLMPIELCVLRLGSYELDTSLDVPYRVVMNEALELTKKFGTQDGFKFVNGVLDKTAKKLRSAEYNHH